MVLPCHRRVSVPIRRGYVPDRADQCVPASPGLDHGRGARRSVVAHRPLWTVRLIFGVDQDVPPVRVPGRGRTPGPVVGERSTVASVGI